LKGKSGFRLIFHNKNVKKDLIIACDKEEEKRKWIESFLELKRRTFDHRTKLIKQRLEEINATKKK